MTWIAENALYLALAAVLVAAWWLLRSRATPHDRAAGVEALLAGDTPVVVELYDNG